MGGVNHHDIHALVDQQIHTLFQVSAHAHRRAHQQAALGVFGGIGKIARLLDILDRDQALDAPGIIHQGQLFDLVLLQDALGLVQGDAYPGGHQVLMRHELADRQLIIARLHKAYVTVGQDAHQAVAFINNGYAADMEGGHDLLCFAQPGVWPQRVRLNDHARLRALHLIHLGGLLLGRHVAVNDAQPALACQGNCQARLGHRIHGCREQRDVQTNARRKLDADIGLVGQHLGVAGHDQHIVKGQRFEGVEKFLIHGSS